MTRPVHIVALSTRTPVGRCAAATAAAVRAGICRVREHPYLVDPLGNRLCCGFDAFLDPAVQGADRLLALSIPTLQTLIHHLSAKRTTSAIQVMDQLHVTLSLCEPRPGLHAQDLVHVALRLKDAVLPQHPGPIELLDAGHAGVLHGLQTALQTIQRNERNLCIVAGVDSYLDADGLTWLDAQRRLAHAQMRGGVVPGESAAMVALASEEARVALGLPSLGCLRAAFCGDDGPDSEDTGPLGFCLTRVIKQVGTELTSRGAVVDNVYCDLNGERSRTDDWGFALLRTSALFRDGTAYRTPVGACGDLGAATAAVNVALAVQAWERGYAQGRYALIWGASWGGLRGATLLERAGAST